MNLETAPYLDQIKVWPSEGHHILAQYDAHSIIVYQAFRSSIADFAIQGGKSILLGILNYLDAQLKSLLTFN
ncbi:MAG: DUF4291 family protein [Candidatus Hermodarchaeota archaeon]